MSANTADDFILTLSDDETGFVEDVSDEAFASQSDSNSRSTTKKRKRDFREIDGHNSKGRGKKRKLENQDLQRNGSSLPSDGSKAGDQPDEDEAIDPDFEFDIGGVADGVIEDFDGWGEDGRPANGEKSGEKKAVDIDDIITRRQLKKEVHSGKDQKANESIDNTSQGSEVDGAGAEIEEEANFEDDELLAPDGFGIGADSEAEESAGEQSGLESHEDDEAEDNDSVSENDSIASPAAHPDDAASVASSNDDTEDLLEKQKREAFFAPEEKSSTSKHRNGSSLGSFQDFSLSRPILKGVATVGFTTPTPIQQRTIPVALLGRDVVGGAVTGSGKTAAFIVPILERLLYRPRKVPTSRVAILMPTRELAVQCFNVATKLASFTDVTFCQLVGGFSLREQENVLKKRPDVIIATPGRFIDHMRNSASFTVDTLEILVLDEADRMLEDGFSDELNEILGTIPKSRQTMLFSATMTDSVDKLIRVGLNRPLRLMVDAKKTVGTLVQEFVRLRPGRESKRLGYLMLLCKTVYTHRVIIFFRQKREAHRARIVFGLSGLKAAELHGSMSQDQRIKSVEGFRDGRTSFLLATDLASRGLDIKGVETVINYEAPQNHEIYLHRVGRTARAGRTGRACTIAAEPDRKVVKAAVKAGRAQGAKIVSRVVDPAAADEWASKVEKMKGEIEEILKEEREEKQMAQAEMQVTRGQNLITHENEIMSRPKRTWFESEKEKRVAKKLGRTELNGPDVLSGKKEKRKLSGKDKKRLDDSRERKEGKVWKKGKVERNQKGPVKGKSKKGKKRKRA